MNNNTNSKADLWADRIHAFQESGLSRKEWCQQNEIPLSTLGQSSGNNSYSGDVLSRLAYAFLKSINQVYTHSAIISLFSL